MKNLLKKLHQIMADVDYIQKDKKNTFQNYNYTSEAAIKERLHESLVKNKIMFFLNVINTRLETNTETKSKEGVETKKKLLIADFEYTFQDVETEEKFVGKFSGTGEDTGDKALYKAITGAIKYIMTSTFIIPTGDDPEEDEKPVNIPVKIGENTKLGSNSMLIKTCKDCQKEFKTTYTWALQCTECYSKSKFNQKVEQAPF